MKRILLTALALALLSGCADDDGARYDKLKAEYQAKMEEFNASRRASEESEKHLLVTSRLLQELDEKSQALRARSSELRRNIPSVGDAATLRRQMNELDRMVNETLALIERLEAQSSGKNLKATRNGLTRTASNPDERARLEAGILALEKALATLSGIRDLVLSQYNDLVVQANVKLRALADNGAPLGELTAETNPIVDRPEQGGRVQGIARDSVSGAPIGNAFVGFKRRPESLDYFYETRTDENGRYASPHLRPGTYYLDIEKRGFISVTSQPVRINLGRQSEENLSLSEPLEEGVYRITMSWTDERPGAVRDVDSYLAIPGVTEPLSYRARAVRYNGAHLDRDDTDWIGPETITILDLKRGTYVYYVNNYNARTDATALGKSEIRVKVYRGDRLLHSLSVPAGRGLNYELFRIVDGTVQLTGRYNPDLRMH